MPCYTIAIPMDNIEFDDDIQTAPRSGAGVQQQPEKSWMFRLVVKLSGGKITDQKGVDLFLVVFSLIIIAVSALVFMTSNDTQPKPVQEQPIYISDIPPEIRRAYALELADLPNPFYPSDLPEGLIKELAASTR